jgi:hypothetical protein
MATIKLTDGFGLVIDASPGPSSIFSKYLKSRVRSWACYTT